MYRGFTADPYRAALAAGAVVATPRVRGSVACATPPRGITDIIIDPLFVRSRSEPRNTLVPEGFGVFASRTPALPGQSLLVAFYDKQGILKSNSILGPDFRAPTPRRPMTREP